MVGWLVLRGLLDEIYLINLFTRAKIQLPSRSKFPDVKDYCVDRHDDEYTIWNSVEAHGRCHLVDSNTVRSCLTDKLIISSNLAATDDYVVAATYGEFSGLAYCKHGDEKWTSLCGNKSLYSDIIFYKGKIHALMKDGFLCVINIHPDNPLVEELAPPHPMLDGRIQTYIVESSNELLLVERKIEISNTNDLKLVRKTIHFNVFKLDHARSRWCKITDIENEVLFIGFNTVMSISSLKFSELKRNSIYFTDSLFGCQFEGIDRGLEIGIFDLNSKSMEPVPGYQDHSKLVWPTPIWLLPTHY